MKESVKKVHSISKKFLKYLFIFVTLLVIALLYPGRANFQYQFSQGEKWDYETIIAPFNFSIKRTEAELNKEEDNIKNSFIPVFKNDSEKINDLYVYLDNFTVENDTSEEEFAKTISFFKKELSLIYKSGVVSEADYKKVNENGLIVNDKSIGNKKEKSQIQTIEKVKAEIKERLQIYHKNFAYIANQLPIKANLQYDKELNKKLLEEELNKISPNAGVISKGDTIIAHKELITKRKYQILNSYKTSHVNNIGKSSSFYLLYVGYFVLSLIIIGILLLFIYKTDRKIYDKPMHLLFLLIWIMLFSYLISVIDPKGVEYVYVIPFSIVPIIVLNFFRKYLALYLHIVIILIASLITNQGYEFTVLQLVVGMIAVLIFSELLFWNNFFKGIFIVFATYVIGYIALSMINTGSLAEINWKVILSFVFNALLLLLAYPLIPLIEKPFGFVSKITLSELGDLNKPLLKELTIKAPGTLQHSLQVGNLSEAAAKEIGVDSLTIKVGALYHDIGKTYAPEFFIENQKVGDAPYENLNNFESAEKILNHVTQGLKIAKKHGLPKIIQRFITTHHGTTRVEYFYRKQVNDFPDQEFDENIFRYQGPKPKTKEESIMMIADSLEAAAKSLQKPTGKDIDDLVENITKYKIDDNQLSESELTFGELQKIKEVFKNVLKNIHHIRIEYPEMKK